MLLGPSKGFASNSATTNSHSATISILDLASLGSAGGSADIHDHLETVGNMVQTLQKTKCQSLLLGSGNLINASEESRETHIRKLTGIKGVNADALVPGELDLRNGSDYYRTLIEECNLSSPADTDTLLPNNMFPHQVVQKGRIRAGIISNTNTSVIRYAGISDEHVSRLNNTAAFLKNSKNCDLIIYVQNCKFNDKALKKIDLELAAATKGIDMMISWNNPFKHQKTYIARNADRQEIIINFSVGEYTAKRLEISYNDRMQKTNVTLRPIV